MNARDTSEISEANAAEVAERLDSRPKISTANATEFVATRVVSALICA